MSSRTRKAALPTTSPQTEPMDLSYASLAQSRHPRLPKSRRPPPQKKTSKPIAAAKKTSQEVPWLGHPGARIRTTLTQRISPQTGTTGQAGRARSPTPRRRHSAKRTTNPEPNLDSRSLNLTTNKPPSPDTVPPQVLYLKMRNGPPLRYIQEVQTKGLFPSPEIELSTDSNSSDTVIKHYAILLTVGLHLLTLVLVAKVIIDGA